MAPNFPDPMRNVTFAVSFLPEFQFFDDELFL